MYYKILIFLIMMKSVAPADYSNFSLYRVTAFNEHERTILYSFYMENHSIIFFNGVTNDAALPMNVFVDSWCTDQFEETLQIYNIEFSRIYEDVWKKEIGKNRQERLMFISESNTVINLSSKFLSYANIITWAKQMSRKHVSLKYMILEKTYEARELLMLKLSKGGDKPAVFIVGGEQGRDWASPAMIINFIHYFMENPVFSDSLISKYDFYFIPVFNPDGYHFSMTQDRMWNKNRKQFFPQKVCPNNISAIGVNIDRNWYYDTSANDMNEDCDAIYMGHTALSEEESLALSNFLNLMAYNIMAFINLRGFTNLITLPYAQKDEVSNNHDIVKEIIMYAIKKIRTSYNISFNLGNSGSCYFNYTGGIPDWVKKKLNVPVVFTIHLTDDQYFFPSSVTIVKLTEKFSIIMRETLTLANSIYGPLFSQQSNLHCNNYVLISFIIMTFSL